jgi:peptide/nickel transport system ATP-binding protein
MAGTGTAHLRDGDALVRIDELVVEYRSGRRRVSAVAGLSLDLLPGETLGLVGESGSGKSSTGRAVLMLRRPTAGRIFLDGRDLTRLPPAELRRARRRMHLIFQDPASSLNPRRRVRDLVVEGLSIARAPKPWRPRADAALHAVGLDPVAMGDRYPSELSGGQGQRVAIARALVLEPALLICDEPVSALDVSVQAQILNLLEVTKRRYGLTLLFIAHDLAVVRNISDRIAVLYLGKLCEVAPADVLCTAPLHPYTQALLDAVIDPDSADPAPGSAPVEGEASSPTEPPSGCRFRTRCCRAGELCARVEPTIQEFNTGHYVACHYPGPWTPMSGTTPRDGGER